MVDVFSTDAFFSSQPHQQKSVTLLRFRVPAGLYQYDTANHHGHSEYLEALQAFTQ